MAQNIRRFFQWWEEVWEAFPDYVKIFVYSVTSSLVGLYLAGEAITIKTVIFIFATNLGIYKIPREGAKQIKKML